MINSGAISGNAVYVVLSVAAAYGGLAQLLAGMWAFREGNTFAAVAFSSYGAFWISFVFLEQFFGPEVVKGGLAGKGSMAQLDHAVALYLFCWGFFTFYMWIASFRLNVALNLVFLTLTVAYVLLGLGDIGSGNMSIMHVGGYFTIAAAVFAWYTSAAIVINKTIGRDIVPLGPLTKPTPAAAQQAA